MHRLILPFLGLLFVLYTFSVDLLFGRKSENISGVVTDGTNPVAEARVRIQGSNDFVLTDNDGRFTITTSLDSGVFESITAGKEGWYNSIQSLVAGDTAGIIEMTALPDGDNLFYEFKDPEYCISCHQTPYSQWFESKHSNATTNPMLLQMYNGTDIFGNPGVAPGYKLDYPGFGGDCADCHAPSAALLNPGNADLNDIVFIGGADARGVHCDFCHKVQTVEVNYETGVNGSIKVKRPFPTSPRDINMGPFDDVTTPWMGGTYNPVFDKSEFCSGCHQYSNDAGVIVDDTYDSWAVSSYAADGIQCQDCHMKPNADSIFVSGIGIVDAVPRDPEHIYNHYFSGAASTEYLDVASQMAVTGSLQDDNVNISVAVTNAGAGHKLPTGVSFRNMLLVVSAAAGGDTLTLLGGERIPPFGGIGEIADGNYGSTPGKSFALVTRNGDNGEWPVPNWHTTEILFDSRIPAGKTDSSTYQFAADGATSIDISVKLLYRAVFKPWADDKGWDMREYVMEDTTFTLQITGIDDAATGQPEAFALHQNFPNPFNGVTIIPYTLPEAVFVNLAVYNIRGQQIATLINGRQSAGIHRFTWDGKNQAGEGVPSGIYFYRIQAGNFSKTLKMLLVE